MKISENLVYGSDAERQVLDLYLPDGEISAVFVYFHGGGLEKGSRKCAARYAPALTGEGIAVASADYRMYPDAAYPDFIRDAAQAVAYVNAWMREKTTCTRLYIGGSSAGGYLSMMLCFDRRYLVEAGVDPSSVAGYLHDAGQPTAHFNVLKYKGMDPRRVAVDETAPLYYVGLEKSYPPMRFIVSDNDMKNRYEQTMLMLSTLSHFGYRGFDHVVMHGKHCEYLGKTDESGNYLFANRILGFIRESASLGQSVPDAPGDK